MSRNRRRQDRRDAVNAGEHRREESPQDPGDKFMQEAEEAGQVHPAGSPERELAEQQASEAEARRRREVRDERERLDAEDHREASTEELIAALAPLRSERANPLTAGIRVFTAMLEQARGGYAADRLAELEAALGVGFNSLEQSGILQISMAQMDEEGIPDVEHGVQLCLEARDDVVEDHGDSDEESQVDGADAYEADTPAGERLEAEGASTEEIERADRATAQAGEPDDPDAPGPED